MTAAAGEVLTQGARPYPTDAHGGTTAVGSLVREVFARARDPESAEELLRLYVGAVEAELADAALRPGAAELWGSRKALRTVNDEEILSSRTTVRWVKELFNFYFRDDLYGALRRADTIVLSSGSPDESEYGLPPVLKQLVTIALDRDWYGYSDSRGRRPARQAVAALENQRVAGRPYDEEWIALTMGGTFAVACLADFILGGTRPTAPALCAVPNYPPLVEAVARRCSVKLVDAHAHNGWTDISALIDDLRPDTPLVLLQTATNPTGTRVPENQLSLLISRASPTTVIILDEAHECLSGATESPACAERARPNVVRVASLSKSFSVPGLKLGWLVAHPDVMRDYYEYASTTYGGPPSVFYLLTEVAARYEAWSRLGIEEPAGSELGMFEAGYGFTLRRLRDDFQSYAHHRQRRERLIVASRRNVFEQLAGAGARPTEATHSINVSFRPPTAGSSYVWFRRCLAVSGVSCFPGILTFGLADDSLRITTARRVDELSSGIEGIVAFTRSGGWAG